MGVEPFKHDHSFNGEVIVAVQEVTLDNIMMRLAFLEHLQNRRWETWFKVEDNRLLWPLRGSGTSVDPLLDHTSSLYKATFALCGVESLVT